jgi:hypothetical protein
MSSLHWLRGFNAVRDGHDSALNIVDRDIPCACVYSFWQEIEQLVLSLMHALAMSWSPSETIIPFLESCRLSKLCTAHWDLIYTL